MKILMVTNKVKTYALGFQNVLEPLKQLGHEVIWAADFSSFIADKNAIPCQTEQIGINTNPFNKTNLSAYRQLLRIIDKYSVDAVMCSTPIGGALARMAAKKKGIQPVLYEAHGFLFFKGAPLLNRTIYKLEEKILAHYTDVLITITKEDYAAAQKFNLRSGHAPYLVHGAGVKVGIHVEIGREEKRRSIGVPEKAFVIVSAGELNRNKNTEVIVHALRSVPDAHYVACGVGPEKDNLLKLSEQLGVAKRFHLLGYRTDMSEIMAASDAFVMPSFREGMPRSLLEAMDLGLPCVGSDTRGIRDLIEPQKGGYLCSPKDPKAFAEAFNALKNDKALQAKMGAFNRRQVQDYSDSVVRNELYEIYKATFGEQIN